MHELTVSSDTNWGSQVASVPGPLKPQQAHPKLMQNMPGYTIFCLGGRGNLVAICQTRTNHAKQLQSQSQKY